MYSEHGFDALIRPAAGQVCQSLIVDVVLDAGIRAGPGGHRHLAPRAASAFSVLATLPSVRRTSCQSRFSSTARMKSSPTRTVLFEFWPETVR